VSLHDVELARRFFPRLVGMRAGRVVFDRPTAEVDPAAVRALYDLGRAEMLADGA
jgi:phosphonate transport system ATP-binding protein